ncbi:MAG TPA: aspartate/glutamate racemase family protein [Alphaproteobacteria bacterium]|jgi:aspartate racemase|nr:aspartate/glutamate racemase family protein [Alphaproteobacteria bacterium]
MKTIGLIGGMSWESSAEYYRLINQQIRVKLGGLHSARIIMISLDFAEIEKLQREGKWQEAGNILINAAQKIEKGGADFLLLCTNTMHKLADEVQAKITIPLLHIADVTAQAIQQQKIRHVGLLGTKFTMEQDFYRKRLIDRFGIKVTIPDQDDRQVIHDIIYQELCLGQIQSKSRQQYKNIINKLIANGAAAIILGCTEIMLLIKPSDVSVPLFNTTEIHVKSAVEQAISCMS